MPRCAVTLWQPEIAAVDKFDIWGDVDRFCVSFKMSGGFETPGTVFASGA